MKTKSTKCVFVVQVDNYQPELCALTIPTIQAWAKRIGADFKLITERKNPLLSPTYEKTQVYELGRGYDWCILVDADIAVSRKMDDPTLRLPTNQVGAWMQYQASRHFKLDPVFARDGRDLAVSSQFLVVPKLCHEFWRPLSVIPEHACSRDFILDEYCFSWNVANLGLKLSQPVNYSNYLFHANVTTEPVSNYQLQTEEWIARDTAPKKRAVVTIAIGKNHTEMAQLTHPLMQIYADRIGAEFVVISHNDGYTYPHYNKMQLGTLLDQYERVAYIDTDILIREDAPDLFDVVPDDCVGLFDEGRFVDRTSFMGYLHSHGVDPAKWDHKYYNTGVMVVSGMHQCMFIRPAQESMHFYEQSYLNLMVHVCHFKIHQLDYKLNRMSCMDSISGETRHDSYFMHYAGCSEFMQLDAQLKLMSEDLEVWRASAPEFKFKKNIAFIVEGGMGDQVCAEPVIRYAIDRVYRGDNVIIACDWPEIFKHLGVPVYHKLDMIPEVGKYHRLHTLRTPEHVSWTFMSHPLVHGVDFCALQAMRMTIPIEARTPMLQYTEADLAAVQTKCGDLDLKRAIVLHPGRGWPSKTFPSDVWQSYADALVDAGFPVIVVGKDLSAEQGTVRFDRTRCVDLVNQLSVAQFFALIASAGGLVSNDSSPVHIAGAFDTPIGLIATCKHPEHVLPYRRSSLTYKAEALERDGLYYDFNCQPSQVNGETIDKCTEKRLRECLPTASRVVEFAKKWITSSHSDCDSCLTNSVCAIASQNALIGRLGARLSHLEYENSELKELLRTQSLK